MSDKNFEIIWPAELEVSKHESFVATIEPIETSENLQQTSANNEPSTMAVVAGILALGLVGALINDRVK